MLKGFPHIHVTVMSAPALVTELFQIGRVPMKAMKSHGIIRDQRAGRSRIRPERI